MVERSAESRTQSQSDNRRAGGPPTAADLGEVRAALEARGLSLRGAFHPEPADRVPDLAPGRPARTLVLAGNVGSSLWAAFSGSPEFGLEKDRLNAWSRRLLEGLAEDLGARALFPFGGPPYQPFIAWAKRAEPVAESPLGVLIHPDYGLWHAYRGALAFDRALALPPPDERPRPCEACAERPCLRACPVGAFRASGYAVGACVDHLDRREGAACREGGCLARHACPVGQDHAYLPAQAAFHMTAFIRAHLGRDPAS